MDIKFSMDKFLTNLETTIGVSADDEYIVLKTKSILEMAVGVPYIDSQILDGITMEELEIAISEVESYTVGLSSPNHLLNEMLMVQQTAINLSAITIKQTNNGLDFF